MGFCEATNPDFAGCATKTGRECAWGASTRGSS